MEEIVYKTIYTRSNTNLKNSSRGIQCHVISKYRSHSTNKKIEKKEENKNDADMKIVQTCFAACFRLRYKFLAIIQQFKQFKFDFKKYAHTHTERNIPVVFYVK